MRKEYGGYLPLELEERFNEYFLNDFSEDDIVRLDCGRSSFWYALKCINPKKVYVPYLNCKSSVDPIEALSIPYEYYCLDDNLMPKDIKPGVDEALLWVNYYGNASENMLNEISDYTEHTNVIVDFCHAFYARPIKNAWNCFSMRKFFGVCDGAYLVKKNIPKIELKQSTSAEDILFILECIEKGTNACYTQNLRNEERLGHECREMSVLTRKILRTIDYDRIKNIRRNNFLFLHELLKPINEFNVNTSSETHMYYPLLVTNDFIRERLVSRHIYTPTWWRHVPDYFSESESDNIECRYSKYMLMIPIDQRYSEEDMLDISKIIMEEYEALCR